MVTDGEVPASGEPSVTTGSVGGGTPTAQEPPNAPVAPRFDYEERGQNPANIQHRDIEIKRTS
jgi:hypothetical protein